MARPQFTLRTMLAAVSYLALGFGCVRAGFVVERGLGVGLWYFGIVSIGAGIGAICNKTREWMAATAIIGIGLFLVLVLVLGTIR